MSDTFVGHVNWFPVTVEGKAGWGDHGEDDDYTFTFPDEQCDRASGNLSGNRLSVNDRCNLHVEFDSDETIDQFKHEEWGALRDAVDAWTDAKGELLFCKLLPPAQSPCSSSRITQAEEMFATRKQAVTTLFNGHTILTGMFGLDGEHDLKAELHPLYAMATRRENRENGPDDEAWLMFVRNRGDEGFCSSQLWDAGFEDYTFRLPWRVGTTSVDVNWSKTHFDGTDGTSGPTVAVIPPAGLPGRRAGVYVTFHLGPGVQPIRRRRTSSDVGALNDAPPGQPVHAGSSADGNIGNAGVSSALPAADETDEVDEVDEVEEHSIRAAISQLPASQRREVEKARGVAGARPAVHRLSPTGPIQMITQPPAIASIGGLHAIKAGPATRKLERDAAQMRALCAATHNAPTGFPASICSSNVRDHR